MNIYYMSDWKLFRQIAGGYDHKDVAALYRQVGGKDVLSPLTEEQRDALAERAAAYSKFSDQNPMSKMEFYKYLNGEYYDAIDVADSLSDKFFARGRGKDQEDKDNVHIAMNEIAMDVMPMW